VRRYLGFVVAVVPANCKVMSSNPFEVYFLKSQNLPSPEMGCLLIVTLGCLFKEEGIAQYLIIECVFGHLDVVILWSPIWSH